MIETGDIWPIVSATAVWWSPIVAGFIGAFGVHLLTQSSEREKWIFDSKKQEYREIAVCAITIAYQHKKSSARLGEISGRKQ